MTEDVRYQELRQLLRKFHLATVDAVVKEIRTAGLITDPSPAVPPPQSPEDEAIVISAMLDGHAPHLGDLQADVFCQPVHRWAFEQLRAKPDLGAEGLKQLEPAYSREIEHLASRPFRHAGAVDDSVRHLRELYRGRRLGERLKGTVHAVWMGTMTVDQAVRRLSKLANAPDIDDLARAGRLPADPASLARPVTKRAKDENDRLKAGELPSDPMADCVPVSAKAKQEAAAR